MRTSRYDIRHYRERSGNSNRCFGSFIQNNGRTVSETTWFDFDRLVFDTGSATLRPESQEQLNNIAAILTAYPNVRMKVGGYTDNVGGADRNLQLSRGRANTVVAELVRRGISPGRLGAEGYGEQYPVADNSTEQGRAQNRRVSMRVTQKLKRQFNKESTTLRNNGNRG